MLAVSLCLGMIMCSTLPILANNHIARNSKITLLSVRSSGGGGGGGSSSGGGGGSSSGGGGGSSSGVGGGSSSGGGGSSSSSGRSSGGGGGSSSGGGRSSSGGGGTRVTVSGAGGGSGSDPDWSPDDAIVKPGDPDYYDPLVWDSIADFYEYRDNANNSLNKSGVAKGSSSGGGPSSSGSGPSTTGWIKNSNNNKWYYYENNQQANSTNRATGWKQISGSWYYFGQDGAMYQNTVTPDGYYVDSNGAWVK